ncbi:MAG: regulatory protein RecX [Clostridia bacterium]|nr:regulatory protein RecX [Clostridia bacterium]
MIIDEIRRQKGHLVVLYSEGEPIVSLDSDLADEMKLQAGRDYTVEELQALLTQSQFRRARAKALYLLEFKDYPRRELITRLRKDFDEASVRAAVDFLEEISAIDDRRYAEAAIRHLAGYKHYGRRRILQELSQKGIDRDTAEEALDAYGLDEPAMILELLEGRFDKDLSDPKGIQRTIATLTRYGFGYGDIRDALREYTDRLEE